MTELENDILDCLSDDPETVPLLAQELDFAVPEEAIRAALEGLEARGLVRSAEGIDPFDPAPTARATWWVLTDEGRRLVSPLP